MSDFWWNVFLMTGDVDAYVLSKQSDIGHREREEDTISEEYEEASDLIQYH
ncbi:YqzL family protein [Longirhabdus pacifica]|uniref:YqzL family protein n=1 Tax=Longirhabdus pacifica TaxID=2305227 RepID=UPI001008FD08|nr:YqzL family protein [Longirhabdus pacifica]